MKNITFNSPFYTVDGVEYIDEDEAITELLKDGICCIGIKDNISIVAVISSDVFCWACADSDDLPYNEIANLYKAYKNDKWGVIKWLCRQRKMQPQKPIVRDMKKDGAWTDELETLPEAPPS